MIILLEGKPLASIDDVHRLLGRGAIGRNLEISLLKDWTTRLDKSIVPEEARQ